MNINVHNKYSLIIIVYLYIYNIIFLSHIYIGAISFD